MFYTNLLWIQRYGDLEKLVAGAKIFMVFETNQSDLHNLEHLGLTEFQKDYRGPCTVEKKSKVVGPLIGGSYTEQENRDISPIMREMSCEKHLLEAQKTAETDSRLTQVS